MRTLPYFGDDFIFADPGDKRSKITSAAANVGYRNHPSADRSIEPDATAVASKTVALPFANAKIDLPN